MHTVYIYIYSFANSEEIVSPQISPQKHSRQVIRTPVTLTYLSTDHNGDGATPIRIVYVYNIKITNSPSKQSTSFGLILSSWPLFQTYSAFSWRFFLSRIQSSIRFRPSSLRPSSLVSSGSLATFGSQWRRPPPNRTCG